MKRFSTGVKPKHVFKWPEYDDEEENDEEENEEEAPEKDAVAATGEAPELESEL